ncbi:MAG: hypothetical protein NMK33_00635 [Candidatus Cardinium sp.]|uniref:hypothetical protein n=1 Tax=Cardinium endosymbiont of Dermatophagoides farinae TaxID=2597823 RepID=UPI0011835175|nr:hypothetical protein [Cardinium endosymbiont of Dermatophagoides farinae]TSJ81032.1 hypothetical protein FPG78_03315 [Cardinium endosymbiont of Dermatophagoides farinae]UWW97059.1 MAG: hypothetical protein NMK33_00635 [Candidatus Cardinium sp.]
MGCSQPGANMVRKVASEGLIKKFSNIKSIFKKNPSEIKVKFAKDDVDVMVRYKIGKDDKLHLDGLFLCRGLDLIRIYGHERGLSRVSTNDIGTCLRNSSQRNTGQKSDILKYSIEKIV